MPYTDLTQVKKRARGTLSPDDTPTAYDETITEGIAWAEAKINAKLADRYTVPFDPVPTLVAHCAADYAGYFALVEAFAAGGENAPTLLAQELKNRADECLADLADGSALLGNDSTDASTELGVWSNTASVSGILTEFDLATRPNISNRPARHRTPLAE